MKDSNIKIQDHIDVFYNFAIDLFNLENDLNDERNALQLLNLLSSYF
jgi:hypothetical protein